MSSCGDSCFTRCRAALCGFVSAASSPTVAAVNFYRFADAFSRLPCRRRTQPHRMLLPAVLPAHGSARIAAELWSSSKSSLPNRCFGELSGGRTSLTPHSSRSSSNRSLAAAGTLGVCPACARSHKKHLNVPRRSSPALIFQVVPVSEATPDRIDGSRFDEPEVLPSIEHP